MSRSTTVVYRPATPTAGGRVDVHPAFAGKLAALGIDSAAGFLDLPGEVVSGHPDRHVVRVELPGFATAFYLKRQHAVTWRERLRNRLAGFAWSSRCAREATLLKQLAAAGLPCPRWVAFGEDGRGRAFLLVEEVAGAVDLRRALGEGVLPLESRRSLAERLGRLVALAHATGFTTPDLTAKHLFVSRGGDITPIDWQSSRRVRVVRTEDRLRALAMLHASVADHLASPRERLRVLRAALAPAREAGIVSGRFADLARRVTAEAERFRDRRSIRDQRQPTVTASQRLVWVAGEAVCATPDVAAIWSRDAIVPPFYGCIPGELRVTLSGGRDAHLIRGRSFSPFARLVAKLRGRPWRSPGVTLGRVLFHLERYGIPAPRLLAFGQRLTGVASAEWFALHTLPPDALPEVIDPATAEQLGRLLRQLHDAGCRVVGDPRGAFGLNSQGASVRDLTRVVLAKRLTAQDRDCGLARLVALQPADSRAAIEAGYRSDSAAPAPRLTRAEVSA